MSTTDRGEVDPPSEANKDPYNWSSVRKTDYDPTICFGGYIGMHRNNLTDHYASPPDKPPKKQAIHHLTAQPMACAQLRLQLPSTRSMIVR